MLHHIISTQYPTFPHPRIEYLPDILNPSDSSTACYLKNKGFFSYHQSYLDKRANDNWGILKKLDLAIGGVTVEKKTLAGKQQLHLCCMDDNDENEDRDRKANDRMLAKSFLKEIKFL